MKIFIDDIRNPNTKYEKPLDWVLVKSYDEFEIILNSALEKKMWIDEISFDYILGNYETKDGNDCFILLLEKCRKYGLDIPKITIHSEYPNAEKKFQKTANQFYIETGVKIDITKI